MSKLPPKNSSEFIHDLKKRGDRSNTVQVTVDGVNHSGVVPNRTRSRVSVHSQIEYGDMRSYLRRIISCRKLVHNSIQFIIREVRKGLPVTKDVIEQFLGQEFGANRNTHPDLPFFIDRMYILIYCMIENVSICRFRKAGLHNKWLSSLSLEDCKLFAQYEEKFKAVANSGHQNRYFGSSGLPIRTHKLKNSMPPSDHPWYDFEKEPKKA